MTQPALSQGFDLIEAALSDQEVERCLSALAALSDELAAVERGGVRHVLSRVPAARAVVRHPRVREAVTATIGSDAFAVRGILFDKHAHANWKVPWHQDLTVAVREERAVEGYGPWSRKDGVPHVQAPAAVLEQMVTVRIHLDACGSDNGPVRVIPGSHVHGIMSAATIDDVRARGDEVECTVGRGGLLVMRPLLLHASSAAREAGHRRVLHVEFAGRVLDGGLEWYERWPCGA